MANKYVKQEKYGLLLLVELVHVLSWSVTLPKMINETKDSILDETDSIILDKIFTHSFHGYTFYIKQNMINNYTAACTIDNCYICNQ